MLKFHALIHSDYSNIFDSKFPYKLNIEKLAEDCDI